MSPKKPVLPLSYMCIKFVSRQLILALADDEGRNYSAIENYFCGATYEVLQDLLKNILNSANLDASTRFSCLEVLLREDVQRLDTGIFPHSYYVGILEIITRQGIGIQQLNLKGVWVRDYGILLDQLVRSLSKLKVLIVPHMVDDVVLKGVLSCRMLTVLDISGECSFTTEGIGQLKSDVLAVLSIGSFGKKDVCQHEASNFSLIAQIIENLPNLAYLRTYSFTGSALLQLYNKPSSPRTRNKTKLKYLHDTCTTIEIIEAIIDLCPDLESIQLDTPQPAVIIKLIELKKLNCAKLTRPDNGEIVNYLRTSGSRLQVLKLNHNKNCSLDLSDICLCAPNLLTLECFQMKLSYSQLDTFFMNLENVEVLYCDMSDTSLKCILTNCPFLKRIVVGFPITITDGDVFRLCAECDFMNLQEIWFSSAKALSVTTVELLMRHCPNLKIIGQLNGWDIIQEEVDYLRSVINYTNTDLTLLPLESF